MSDQTLSGIRVAILATGGFEQSVNQEAVVDGQLVTSRNPDDIPSFNREITRLFDRCGRQHERHRHADPPRRAV